MAHPPEKQTEATPPGKGLVSPELAELYLKQGDYERGIGMLRTLLSGDPDSPDLKARIEEAEGLANLLTLRTGGDYDRGFREGLLAGREQVISRTRKEKVQRLTRWLERIRNDR
ncbi:MAG: tetratricopeptide repeat protein [Leptospirillia bacterium]